MPKPVAVCILLISAISTISCTPRDVQAGEVVLKFTAIIDELNGDVSRIPVPLEVGDTITTDYIFDAALFDAKHTSALGSQRLTLDDLVLHSSNLSGLSLNVWSPLAILCSWPTNSLPGCNGNLFVLENTNLIWDPTLVMYADAGSLQTLADVRSVSSLSSIGGTGILNIKIFASNQTSWEQVLTIQAALTEFVAVPETAALILGTLAAGMVVAGFRTRKR